MLFQPLIGFVAYFSNYKALEEYRIATQNSETNDEPPIIILP